MQAHLSNSPWEKISTAAVFLNPLVLWNATYSPSVDLSLEGGIEKYHLVYSFSPAPHTLTAHGILKV
jgi:hypothetical protein